MGRGRRNASGNNAQGATGGAGSNNSRQQGAKKQTRNDDGNKGKKNNKGGNNRSNRGRGKGKGRSKGRRNKPKNYKSSNKGIRQELSKAIKVVIRHLPSELKEHQVVEWLSEYNKTAPAPKTPMSTTAPTQEEKDAKLIEELENTGDAEQAPKPAKIEDKKAPVAAELLYFVSGKTKKSGVVVHSRAYVQCPDQESAARFIKHTHGRGFAAEAPVPEPEGAEASETNAEEGAAPDGIKIAVVKSVETDKDTAEPEFIPCQCMLAPFPVIVLASHDPKYEDTIQYEHL